MAQLTLFQQDDRPPQAARLGPRLRRSPAKGSTSAPARGSTRAGWDRSTAPGDIPSGAGSREPQVRDRMPGRVCRDLPRGLRRLQLLPVPRAPITGDGSSGRAPARSSSPSRSPRRSPSRPGRGMPGTADAPDSPTESFLDAGLFEHQFAGPLEPYQDRVATLIFEFGTIPQERLRHGGRVRRPARRLPRGLAGRVSLRRRDPQSRIPRPGLLRHAGTPRRRACVQCLDADAGPRCPGRRCPGPSPPISRSSVPCSAPGGPTSRPSAASRRIATSASPTRSTRDALVEIAGRARQYGQPAYVFVNNRLEGNAPSTIEAVADALEPAGKRDAPPPDPQPVSRQPLAGSADPDRMILSFPTERRAARAPDHGSGVAFFPRGWEKPCNAASC